MQMRHDLLAQLEKLCSDVTKKSEAFPPGIVGSFNASLAVEERGDHSRVTICVVIEPFSESTEVEQSIATFLLTPTLISEISFEEDGEFITEADRSLTQIDTDQFLVRVNNWLYRIMPIDTGLPGT